MQSDHVMFNHLSHDSTSHAPSGSVAKGPCPKTGGPVCNCDKEQQDDKQTDQSDLQSSKGVHHAGIESAGMLDTGVTVHAPTTEPMLPPHVQNPTSHPDDAAKQGEHEALLKLVPYSQATHVAVNDGRWSNPSTWSNGKIPDGNARVVIGEEVDVLYDVKSDARLKTVRIDGSLTFAPNKDTQIVVDTLVNAPSGTLRIGTAENPIQSDKMARIIIADNGPIDIKWDPQQLSRGVISHGAVEIYGQEKTSHLKLANDAMAGDTKLVLSALPENWQVGDSIVLTATHLVPDKWNGKEMVWQGTQDEELTIAAINGKTITLDRPLQHNHDTPNGDLKAYVANYSRNVVVETENFESLPANQRGHVMFMHSDKVDVRYAEFHQLGRTDKSKLLDDFKTDENGNRILDANGDTIKGASTNVRGRYAVHFHRTGVDASDGQPAIAIGNSVWGSPGWGYVHHDSNVVMENNAAYNVFGSAFVAESGNEIGAWRNNIAIKSEGLRSISKSGPRVSNHDIAHNGTGFWFQGRLVENENNVAASQRHGGFTYLLRGTDQQKVLSSNLPNPEIARYTDTVGASIPPINGFKNNETLTSGMGLEVIKANPRQGHDVRSVIDGFKAWEVSTGTHLEYTSKYTLKNIDVVGARSGSYTGISFGKNAEDMVVNGANIEGFKTGVKFTKHHTFADIDNWHYVLIDTNLVNNVQDYDNLNLSQDKVLTSADLNPGRLQFELDNAADFVIDPAQSDRKAVITGTKIDSIGAVEYPSGSDAAVFGLNRIKQGYYTDAKGTRFTTVTELFADRATGELLKQEYVITLTEDWNQFTLSGLLKNSPNLGTYDGVVKPGAIPAALARWLAQQTPTQPNAEATPTEPVDLTDGHSDHHHPDTAEANSQEEGEPTGSTSPDSASFNGETTGNHNHEPGDSDAIADGQGHGTDSTTNGSNPLPMPMPSTASPLRFEAERLDLAGYSVETVNGSGASGGKQISLKQTRQPNGTASGVFNGAAGTYKVTVGYYDEKDGVASATVTVGDDTQTFDFDKNLPHNWAKPQSLTSRVTHKAVELKPGDRFTLEGASTDEEFARFDYIEFTPVKPASAPTPPKPTPETPTPETPTPGKGVDTSSNIGTNLGGIADWSTQYPFTDFFKSARQWVTNGKGVWDTKEADKLDLDENGWIKSFPDGAEGAQFDQVTTIVPNAPKFDRYVVLYDGEGTLNYWGNGVKKVADASQVGRDVIEAPGEASIFLSIKATDPNGTGDYLRNIRVVPEEFINIYQSQPFNPDFIDHLKGFETLRLMDWMKTNGSDQQEWSDRPKPNDFSFAKSGGAPVEVMVELANQTGIDPWFNIPHQATDEYIRKFAEYVKEHLDPKLKAYVEYSNEVWNGGFEQNQYAQAQGEKEFGDLKIPEWVAYHAKRTTDITRTWDEVFGADKDRVVGVFATQAANPWVAERGLEFIQSMGISYEEAGIDTIAIAPYFGGYLGSPQFENEIESWMNEPDGGLSKLFQELTKGGLLEDGRGGAIDRATEYMKQFADLTKREGLTLTAYEGGQHLADSDQSGHNLAIMDLFIAANRDPRMGELYKQYFANWRELGGDVFANFSDIGSPNKYGSWGVLESLYQDGSAKWNALQETIETQIKQHIAETSSSTPTQPTSNVPTPTVPTPTEPTPSTPMPDAPGGSSEIGINLTEIRDYSTQYPFTDFFKSSRQWTPTTPGVWNTGESNKLDLDAQGWVKSLPSPGDGTKFNQVTTIIPNAPKFDRYVVLYDGEGTLNYSGEGIRKVASASQPGREIIEAPGTDSIRLSIQATDPNGTGDYIRNIRVVPEEFIDIYQSQPFNPDFLEHLNGYETLRFMKWMGTKDSQQQEWSDRPQPTDSTFSKDGGVPVELLVELANKTGADPWFSMPHQATEEYVQNFAQYVKENLDPGLQVYVEYSNEVWNSGLGQHHYANAQGQKEFGNLNGPKWIPYHAQRTIDVTRAWDNVFADQKDRVVGVFATQASNPWVAEKGLDYLRSTGMSYEEMGIDTISIAPYVGGYIGEDERFEAEVERWTQAPDGGLNKLFQELTEGGLLNDGFDGGGLDRALHYVEQFAAIAQREGLSLTAYEGGQHLNVDRNAPTFNQAITDLFTNANRDPRMGKLYQEYFTQWRNLGGDLFAHFQDIQAPNRYGAMGVRENLYEEESVKEEALREIIQTNTKLSLADTSSTIGSANHTAIASSPSAGSSDSFFNQIKAGISVVEQTTPDRVAQMGTTNDDVLSGSSQGDRLRGAGRSTRGKGEIDIISGNAGADRFVLGDETGAFYDDGKQNTVGHRDVAVITDFNPKSGDTLQLHGSADLYRVGAVSDAAHQGAGLFKTTDTTDELIAVVQGVPSLKLEQNAVFV